MGMPSTYITWCPKSAKCPWCEQDTVVATPVVMVYFNNRREGKKYNVKKIYHPDCWLAQGLDYLKMNPYSAKGNRGRPTKNMSVEDKSIRLKLLQKKAALEQEKKRLKTPYPERLLLESKLDEKIAAVMLEIAGKGGIPKKWLEKILNS